MFPHRGAFLGASRRARILAKQHPLDSWLRELIGEQRESFSQAAELSKEAHRAGAAEAAAVRLCAVHVCVSGKAERDAVRQTTKHIDI